MLIPIHPKSHDPRKITRVIECLNDGGVVIYPTDTIYSIGCVLNKPKAIERVARLKGIKPDKANFSLICYDLSHVSDYTKQFNTSTYKMMKKALPGPFTFILNASNSIPKYFSKKKKTVGIRVPDHNIPRNIVKELGLPIVTTSIHDDNEVIEYTTDPDLIHEKYRDLVDIVIDGGYGSNIASTVVDCTGDVPQIIRQGEGTL